MISRGSCFPSFWRWGFLLCVFLVDLMATAVEQIVSTLCNCPLPAAYYILCWGENVCAECL